MMRNDPPVAVHQDATRAALLADVWPRRIVVAVLLAIVLLAAALRLAGLGFGLPSVYNPDETPILYRALAFAKGDLNPHNFLYPSLYFYLLFAWIGAYFAGAWLVGAISSVQAFQARLFTDPGSLFLAARSLGVVCGTVTAVCTYAFARRLFGRATGLAAALFVALSPIAVVDSHYVKHDIAVTLSIVLAQVAIASVWPLQPKRAGLWPVILAGGACGFAFSMHYYAVFLALPLALAVAARYRATGWQAAVGKLATAAAAMLVAFFAFSPFILVEPGTAWRDIVANRQIVVDRALTAGGSAFAGIRRYLELLWLDAVGWPAVVLAVLGAILLCRRSWRHALFLLMFPATFLLFISNTVPASRYLNPVIPSLAVLAAYGCVRLASTAGRESRHVVAGVLVVAAALPAVIGSVRADRFFIEADTRTLARQFIEEHLPSGTCIAVQPYSVQLWPSRESLRDALRENLGTLDSLPARFALQLQVEPYPPGYRLIYIGDGGLDADKLYVSYRELGNGLALHALRARGVQYAVVKRYNNPQPTTLPFLRALAREGRRIAFFSPYRSDAGPEAMAAVEPYLHNTDARIQAPLQRPGPLVEIWQLNDLGPQNH